MTPFETASVVTTPLEAPSAAPEGGAIFKSSVLLVLELRRPGVRRTVKTAESRYNDVGEAAKQVHVSKDILDSQELVAIAQAHGELRRYVQSKCLPSRFKSGTYLLPICAIEQVDDHIQSAAQQIEEKVNAFIDAYPQRKTEALAKLAVAGLADDADYPDPETLRAGFDVKTAYVAFDTPSTLKAIRRDIFEREREKAAATWASAVDEGRALLLDTFSSLTDAMVERLTPGEDGKPKVFRDSLVTNMTAFLDTFTAKNTITNDAELAAVVADMRGLLAGVSPKDLRKDEAIRATVTENVTRIKDHLASMVINKPARAFSFHNED